MASDLIRFVGQFHPAVIHFPIALLITAAAAEMLAIMTRKEHFHSVTVFSLVTGTLGAIAAAVLGWALAFTTRTDPDLHHTLFLHRWLGTATAVWAVIVLLLWGVSHKSSGVKLVYRLSLIIGAVLVSITGHLGGLLVYGLDYYSGL